MELGGGPGALWSHLYILLMEIGLKRVEYELDETVERWGLRLVRRGFGERFWKGEREDIEEVKV